MLAPYSDDPHNSGLSSRAGASQTSPRRALRSGFQVCTHAIGDRANRLVLDAYERVLAGLSLDDARAPLRIEHAQILAPAGRAALRRARDHPVDADDPSDQRHGVGAGAAGPDRLRGAYAWRSLLDTGVIVPNGTDAPVESLNTVRPYHAPLPGRTNAARRSAAGLRISA